jgi:hypothetical protein
VLTAAAVMAATVLSLVPNAFGREIVYSSEVEANIYVRPGDPTEVEFPGAIKGGFKRSQSQLTVDRRGEKLVVFPKPGLTPEGERLIISLEDGRSYALRILPADEEQNRADGLVTILDDRQPKVDDETDVVPDKKNLSNPQSVAGLMRELVLVAEFGKQKGIPGYRRSSRFSGETVLDDGALRATIKEIFLGSNLWGYVLEVENLLQTTQRINPATFRLDGTRAVSAERWELAPRPLTAEQKVAAQHFGKLYIITRSKRN